MVPFAAGSATDTLARVLGEKMSASLGQAVVVDNMPGANGFLAAQNVARAEPDGLTVLIDLQHHARRQSEPVQEVALRPDQRLRAGEQARHHHAGPGRSILPCRRQPRQELIAYAKAKPGELTFGSGSSSSRIAGEMLKTLAGIDMLNVPYKSNPQAVTDLLGGQISLVFADISTTLPQAKAGKVKALAVSSAERTPLAPDLPTMAEAGVPGYDLTAWFAAFVPAGTPRPDRRQAQRGLQGGTCGPAGDQNPAWCGHRADIKHARGAQGLRRRRDREVGQDRQGGRHRA